MTNEQMNNVVRNIKQKGYNAGLMFSGPAHIYGVNFNINPISSMANELKLTRLEISFRLPDLLHQHMGHEIKAKIPNIQLDILHQPIIHDYKASFSATDFECNSLLILSDNTLALRTSSALYSTTSTKPQLPSPSNTSNPSPLDGHKSLDRIIQDIINFKAVAVQPQQHRIAKMVKKGFTVSSPTSITLVSNITTTSYDGTCLVCHGSLDQAPTPHPENTNNDPEEHTIALTAYNDAKRFHVKNNCCDARYHPACYKQSQDQATTEYDNVQKCMMCRSHLENIYSATNNVFCPLAEYSRSIVEKYIPPPPAPQQQDDVMMNEDDGEPFTPPHLVIISAINNTSPPPAPRRENNRRTNRILEF
jgi:hypothetical protein